MTWAELLATPATALQVVAGQFLICLVLLTTNWLLLARMSHILALSLRTQAANRKISTAESADAASCRVQDLCVLHGIDDKLNALVIADAGRREGVR